MRNEKKAFSRTTLMHIVCLLQVRKRTYDAMRNELISLKARIASTATTSKRPRLAPNRASEQESSNSEVEVCPIRRGRRPVAARPQGAGNRLHWTGWREGLTRPDYPGK